MKRIIHVIIAAAYKEGYGYQENILPAKHQELGMDVLIISYDRFGYYKDKGINEFPYSYINDRGVRTIILQTNKRGLRRVPYLGGFTRKTRGLYEALEREKPDMVFIHGIVAFDHLDVVKYKRRHSNVNIFADNHNDYYNSPHKTHWERFYTNYVGRFIAKRMAKACEKIWGVTPWRVDFLKTVFRVPSSKIGLLEMGGDERLINWENKDLIRKEVRERYKIPQDAFLIISGGKIDKAKNIHLLINSVRRFQNGVIPYLLIFGKAEKDMEKEISQIEDLNIIYIGWIPSDDVYPLFLACDLAVFPGTHSVLWEQACASGVPCVFKDWDGGFSHVDVGGNCILLKEPTSDALFSAIKNLIINRKEFLRMKQIAEDKGRPHFSYIEIAKRSINV